MDIKFDINSFRVKGEDCTVDDFQPYLKNLGAISNDNYTYDYTDPDVDLMTYTVGTGNRYKIEVDQRLGLPFPTFTNLTPSQATIDVNGNITRVISGTLFCEYLIKGGTGTKRFYATIPYDGFAFDRTESFARKPGTNIDLLSNKSLYRTSGKIPGEARQNIYSSVTYGSTPGTCAATLNPNCIVADLDFSHLSFSRPATSWAPPSRFPVSLIGPRHIVWAYHVMTSAGEDVIFRRKDGTFQSAKVLKVFNMGSDLACGYLDQDITGVDYATFLPDTYLNKFGLFTRLSDITNYESKGPVVGMILSHNASPGLNPGRHAQLTGIGSEVAGSTGIARELVSVGYTPIGAPDGWYSVPYGGDSSSPVYLIVDTPTGTKNILYTQLFSAVSGPNYAYRGSQIESLLNTELAAVGYSTPLVIQRADLSLYS